MILSYSQRLSPTFEHSVSGRMKTAVIGKKSKDGRDAPGGLRQAGPAGADGPRCAGEEHDGAQEARAILGPKPRAGSDYKRTWLSMTPGSSFRQSGPKPLLADGFRAAQIFAHI